MAERAKKSSSTSKKTTPAKKTAATKAVVTKSTAKPAAKKTVAKKVEKSTGSKPVAKKTDMKSTKDRGSEKLHQRYKGIETELERLCKDYLEDHKRAYGRLTPHKDGGVDIICKKYDDEDDDYPSVVYFVQVKNKKVDVDIVRQLIGSISLHAKNYGDEDTKHIGIIMTTLTATADAIKEGKKYGMKFVEGAELEEYDKKSRVEMK